MVGSRPWIVKVAALAAGIGGWGPRPAHAGEADVAAAQALFDEGKRLLAAGNLTAACPKFEQSQRLDPAGGTLMHLASCHEREGKSATAWSEYNEALSWARRDGRADREAYAKARLEAIERGLLKLTIVVPETVRVAGLTVKRDGRALGEAEWGTAVPVDPGEHLVEAAAPGRVPWAARTRVDAQGGSVAISVPPLEATAAAGPAAPATWRGSLGEQPPAALATPASSPSPGDPGAVRRTTGIALGIAGLVGLGVGVAFDVSAHEKASDRDAAARRGDAQATASLNQQAHTAQTTAFVIGGIGLGALGGGALLYLMAPRAGDVHVVPQVAQNQVGFVLEVVR
jgi:serine/threonine-protein kinase